MDSNGMTPLPDHAMFEALLRPRGNRPSLEDVNIAYSPWVVVCFSAKWCGPCKALDKKSLVQYTPRVKWYAVDVDENTTTLGYCSLRSIPSFVVLKDGVFLDRKSGAGSADEVLEWLASVGVPLK
jgi:thioredoxin-like negative regulator of GroEL